MQDLIIRNGNQSDSNENPICNSKDYESRVFEYVPQITTLDGVDGRGRSVDVVFDTGFSLLADFLTEDTSSIDDRRPARPIYRQERGQSRQNFNQKDRLQSPNRDRESYRERDTVANKSRDAAQLRSKEEIQNVYPPQEELMKRIEQLEKEVQFKTHPPIEPKVDRISSLEEHIESLVKAITISKIETTAQEKENEKPNIVDPSIKAESQVQSERLKSIEAQMKELIQMTANNDKPIVKLTDKDREYRKQKAALKQMEKELFGGSPTSSEEYLSIPTKIPRRVRL